MDVVIRKSKGSDIFNVGSGKSYSILEICEMLSKLMNKKLPIKSNKSKSRKNEISNVISDCSKIKKLGWIPKINLSKGLKLTLDWYIMNKYQYKKKLTYKIKNTNSNHD